MVKEINEVKFLIYRRFEIIIIPTSNLNNQIMPRI